MRHIVVELLQEVIHKDEADGLYETDRDKIIDWNNQKQVLSAMCTWVKEIKGITKIDLIDLVEYLPEFKEWHKEHSS